MSGTTGWLEHKEKVESACKDKNGAFFYASNFSVGVNIFFKLNEYLAKMMTGRKDYKPFLEETHHIHKKDAPSGTAITLAEGLLKNFRELDQWKLIEETEVNDGFLPVKSYRENEVPGTHKITYSSAIDDIFIEHKAHSREGFAKGAVLAAEWLPGKTGSFSMDDMLFKQQ